MIIPPFVSFAETTIDINNVEILTCRKKYEIVVGNNAQNFDVSSNYSEKFGYILRITYNPMLDNNVLEYKNIFICWKTKEGPLHYLISGLDEEAQLREELLSS